MVDEKSAIEFMLKVPNAIKRPIVELDDDILRGFDESVWSKKLIKIG